MNKEERLNLEKRIVDFTGKLKFLAREGYEDRAALAALRSNLGGAPEGTAPQYKYVVPFLGEYSTPKTDRWFFLVGALFAWHPATRGKGSLGSAFRVLSGKENASGSVEARFAALIACDERDLHLHLRQAISLLKANDIPVDWNLLLRHLTIWGWNHPDRYVQSKWARDYYRGPVATSEDIPDDNAAPDDIAGE